jgi:hypothetical protein
MPSVDSHQRAAEFHDIAAHAHRAAAVTHGKEDHLSGHELSRQALEHSTKALEHIWSERLGLQRRGKPWNTRPRLSSTRNRLTRNLRTA